MEKSPSLKPEKLVFWPKKNQGKKIMHLGPYYLIFSYSFLLLVLAFVYTPPLALFSELLKIFTAPSSLITDYIALTSLGAAFLNVALLTLMVTLISYLQRVPLTGPTVAALLMVSGFGFFGKNILNSLPLLLGTYFFSWLQKRNVRSYAIVALFGSSLSPVVSMLAFSSGLPWYLGLSLGYGVGFAIGFILPPLATHFQSFTQGFNLYNVGFTSGMISMLLTGIFRMFGWEITNNHLISLVYHETLMKLFLTFSSLLILLGLYFCWREKRIRLKEIFATSGKIITDFLTLHGLGSTLLNMGLMGFFMLGYVLVMDGKLNGPVLGALISIVGFSAYGNHPLNSLPVLLGAFLAGLVNIYDMNATSLLMAALFSTTLAPISGFYGSPFGLLAGFFHIALVTNVGYLHGGLNLYNNGFSGGFIAALMVPVLDSLHLKKGGFIFGRKIKSQKNSR